MRDSKETGRDSTDKPTWSLNQCMPSWCYGIPDSMKHQFQGIRHTPDWTLNLLSQDRGPIKSATLPLAVGGVNACNPFPYTVNLKFLQSVFFSLWNPKRSLFLMRQRVMYLRLGSAVVQNIEMCCVTVGLFLLIHSVPLCSRRTSQPLIRRHDDAIWLCCFTKGLTYPFTVSPACSFNPQKLHIKIYTFPSCCISCFTARIFAHA